MLSGAKHPYPYVVGNGFFTEFTLSTTKGFRMKLLYNVEE